MPKLNGVYYEVLGQGYPIVFCPGLGTYSKHLRTFTDELVKYNFQIISIDMPGFGKSKKAYTRKSWNKSIDDVIDHFKLKDFAMMGYSVGGLTCLDYATKSKNKPKEIILISSPISSFGKVWLSTAKLVFSFLKKYPRDKWNWKELSRYRIIKTFSENVSGDIIDMKVKHMSRNKFIDQLYFMYLAIGLRPRLKKVKTKSIVFYAEKDYLIDLRDSKKLIKKLNAQSYCFKNMNHSLPYEVPIKLAKQISKFLCE